MKNKKGLIALLIVIGLAATSVIGYVLYDDAKKSFLYSANIGQLCELWGEGYAAIQGKQLANALNAFEAAMPIEKKLSDAEIPFVSAIATDNARLRLELTSLASNEKEADIGALMSLRDGTYFSQNETAWVCIDPVNRIKELPKYADTDYLENQLLKVCPFWVEGYTSIFNNDYSSAAEEMNNAKKYELNLNKTYVYFKDLNETHQIIRESLELANEGMYNDENKQQLRELVELSYENDIRIFCPYDY